MQTAALLVSHRLQNRTIRISTQSTVNQVQNQQKYRYFVNTKWLKWRNWNSLKRWAHVAPHASYIRQWKSWSTACTFTGKKIWKYRAPPLLKSLHRWVQWEWTMHVSEKTWIWPWCINIFFCKEIITISSLRRLYETIQLSTGQYFYSNYFQYFSCPFSTCH